MLSLLTTVAQVTSDYNFDTYSTDYSTTTTTDPAAAALGMGIVFAILGAFLVYFIFTAICMMKIFKKAGRTDSWAAFIPVYNMYVFYQVAGRPGWWAFLGFIPVVGGIASLITIILGSIDMAKSFGKEAGYGIMLAILPIIGYPMLAFGNATYQGPAGPEGQHTPMNAGMPPQPPTQPMPPTSPTPPVSTPPETPPEAPVGPAV